jgi:hypothetical protein
LFVCLFVCLFVRVLVMVLFTNSAICAHLVSSVRDLAQDIRAHTSTRP